MNRFAATLWCDIRLQFRNGFYYASIFVAVISAFLVVQMKALDLLWMLPALIVMNLVIGTFYFFSGLVLLEKGEGTLEAQVVTPLRHWEYLASKVITLSALAVLENTIIVTVAYGFNYNLLLLVLGIGLASALFALTGFLSVARYDAINEYLMPSMLYLLPFGLPLLPYFGMTKSWWYYLHPLQAPLALIEAALRPVPALEIVYGLVYAGLWTGLAILLAQRTFLRFIVAKEGVR